MTTFYFVRHGETMVNQAQCFNGGGTNTALTEDGKAAAERLGTLLAEQSFDALLTSPLTRAVETMDAIVAQLNQSPPPTMIVDNLKEMALGDWEGQPGASLTQHPQYENYFHHPELFDAKQIHAESYQAVLKRGMTVIKTVQKTYPDGDVLIVAHGIILLFVINTMLGIPFAKIRAQKMVANASLSVLKSNGTHTEEIIWNKMG
ncbi:histidine phosphatase family protein [Latilactobacillus graminis]|uniref:Phosphoglycerate mutase family protein n=2 Tax=Latilactobacillus graminis TaxID=60519 RepID=A0AA89I2I2_9LACO|nr:histidine phosphatase family protein [Latilactobacillus graminis]KRM24185.1 phosphoglycerate mutase family protein [Latilactobacillus graminis DSM 20719]QFP78831.1 histidine phosphatase family protein [Latilactobacillus graminis]